MSPSSRASSPGRALAASLTAAALAGCLGSATPGEIARAAARAGDAGAASDEEDRPRQPGGVAIDPALVLPEARHRVQTDQPLVALRAPLGSDVALGTVHSFFQRIVQEDSEGLSPLFTREVQILSGTGGVTQNATAIGNWWEPRFKRLDYGKLGSEPLYRDVDVEVFRGDDELTQAPAAIARTAATMDETDVVVRVPILTPRVGSDRLLGDEMILWMRRDGERYRIYRVMEDFQLP
ncbi:MAG: hypothetical protein WKG00_13080 [Polyangiaceae bacterium]